MYVANNEYVHEKYLARNLLKLLANIEKNTLIYSN